MPEREHKKIVPKVIVEKRGSSPPLIDYVELEVASNFSFLRGGSHPEEFVGTAASYGYRGIAVTDLNTLSGIVRGYTAAKEFLIPFIVGAKLEIVTEYGVLTLLSYPTDRASYGRLCKLLTLGKGRCESGGCEIFLDDYLTYQKDLVTIVTTNLSLKGDVLLQICRQLKDNSSHKDFISLSITNSYDSNEVALKEKVRELSKEAEIELVVTNNVYYHSKARRPLQDVLTCIREHCTINDAGLRLSQNAERYLKRPHEMFRIFKDIPQALKRTVRVLEQTSSFSLSQLKYEYPDPDCREGVSVNNHFRELVFSKINEKFPLGMPLNIKKDLEYELTLISELEYEKYFLTCFDIVRFARTQGILCQGRGSAANSIVCFLLGITSVDPTKINLLFARFVSKSRSEPPDIDMDFEHERREEVIQYIYKKYGRAYAGLVCEVVTYRHRSAIRDVGKALGITNDVVDKIAKSIHYWTGCNLKEGLRQLGISTEDTTILHLLNLSKELRGFPRHLSQHTGGFVISKFPLCETVPILNARMAERTIIEWDKDDIDALGMFKIDVLALGMLTCIRKALGLINRKRKDKEESFLTLSTLPSEDPETYEMICRGDSVGVFQIESRAQISMLPRLKPRCFYDLVIEVAIVRPGPIQGNMVHPYLRRRNKLEEVSYPDKRAEEILGKTLGVPLFQEQAMRLAIALADFTPDEAETLRRAMAAWKRNEGKILDFKDRVVNGMVKNGYTAEFAETCMNQIKGFAEYGFPESHAASFALLVYASSWIKCHYPEQFACAVINSQPMGFYSPSHIIQDAITHKVKVLPINILMSEWDCTIEDDNLRLGFRLIKGLEQSQGIALRNLILELREIKTIYGLWEKGYQFLRKRTFSLLAKADAFSCFGVTVHEALWQIQGLPDEPTPIAFSKEELVPILPLMTKKQEMFQDYKTTGLSLKAHPISFIRQELSIEGVRSVKEIRENNSLTRGTYLSVAGMAVIKQRPGTAKGVVFITLEDETGVSNLMIRPKIFDRFKQVVLESSSLLASGTLDRVGEVIYIVVDKIKDLDPLVYKETAEGSLSGVMPMTSYSY